MDASEQYLWTWDKELEESVVSMFNVRCGGLIRKVQRIVYTYSTDQWATDRCIFGHI